MLHSLTQIQGQLREPMTTADRCIHSATLAPLYLFLSSFSFFLLSNVRNAVEPVGAIPLQPATATLIHQLPANRLPWGWSPAHADRLPSATASATDRHRRSSTRPELCLPQSASFEQFQGEWSCSADDRVSGRCRHGIPADRNDAPTDWVQCYCERW